jgi:hypothetical protein
MTVVVQATGDYDSLGPRIVKTMSRLDSFAQRLGAMFTDVELHVHFADRGVRPPLPHGRRLVS